MILFVINGRMENGHRGRVVHVRHIHATRYCGIGYESETTGHDIMESYMEQIKHSENLNSMQNGRKRMTKTEMRNAFQLVRCLFPPSSVLH